MGMLEESGMVPNAGRPTEEPASGPVTAGEEQMESAEAEVSKDAIVPLDEATQIAYSEEMFPKIVEMFEKGGAEGFPKAMSVSLLGVMQKLSSDQELSDEVMAEVGVKMFEMLTEDIITSGKVEGVTPEIITSAIQESIKLWGQANPERFDPAAFEEAAMGALQASGEVPPITPNPKPRNMVPDESAAPATPPQGGGVM